MNEKIKELKDKKEYTFDDLQSIMRILRSPEGCPWDREQDHKSIRRDFIEETYEVIEAIDTENPELLREELGDVLLQVVFHARI
ncbi:MAG: nucleoside triphosphate pyrophosphohydrolase, partial [Oscillospiraceae bacterium]|nr:nucleoside triphosphate pyrophosphohydrolase [Oscillospiraceae bacterium]